MCSGYGRRDRRQIEQCRLHEAGRHCGGGERRRGACLERKRARRRGSERELHDGGLGFKGSAHRQGEDVSLGLSVLWCEWCGRRRRQSDDGGFGWCRGRRRDGRRRNERRSLRWRNGPKNRLRLIWCVGRWLCRRPDGVRVGRDS